MNFNKMKLGKKGSSNVTGALSDLMVAVILVAVMGIIVITIITIFAPLIQTKSAAAQTAATTANNTASAALWGILATDGIVEVLAVASFVLVVIFVFIGIIKNASKGK